MAKLKEILLPDGDGVYDGVVKITRVGDSLVLTDESGEKALVDIGAGGFAPVQFIGNVAVAAAGNFRIMQKRVYFPLGATITAAQVVGCGGVDPSKAAGDTTVIHVSDTDYEQDGLPEGFDVVLPGNAEHVRVGSQTLSIAPGGHAYVFVTAATGNHSSPSLLLEYSGGAS